METETIDKLFLELSQVTTARTRREIELGDRLHGLLSAVEGVSEWMIATLRLGDQAGGHMEVPAGEMRDQVKKLLDAASAAGQWAKVAAVRKAKA